MASRKRTRVKRPTSGSGTPKASGGTVTIVFTGLCAFVTYEDKRLTVLLPDAREGSARVPPHSAVLGHTRIDGDGALAALPTGMVLEDNALRIEGQPGDGTETITFGDDALAEMDQAPGAIGLVGFGRVAEDVMTTGRSTVARVVIDAAALGVDVSRDETPVAAPSRFRSLTGQRGVSYRPALVGEVRLQLPIPDWPLYLVGSHQAGGDLWKMLLSEPGDLSAVLTVSNVPVGDPMTGHATEHAIDHHFVRYYELCADRPPIIRVPHFDHRKMGGGLPRCAMALFHT